MLDSGTTWSEVAKVGNPTWSTAVNRIVRRMKKMEAARCGKPSQARRSLVPAEFEAIIKNLCKHKGLEVGTWLSAYLSFMYDMIARFDDTAMFRWPDLKPFNEFPDYRVTAKLCWTKKYEQKVEAADADSVWVERLALLCCLAPHGLARLLFRVELGGEQVLLWVQGRSGT